MTLYWNRLLAPKRRREKTSVDQTTHDQRSPFKKDFDTVCNSTILRRLQDKAQVFPLENEDYARTRLTHSIEVMSIAESLGMQAISIIREKDKIFLNDGTTSERNVNEWIENIPTILKTVALLHDMGNPPFGHLGEQIISDWFDENLENFSYISGSGWVQKPAASMKINLTSKLKEEHILDLTNFEGNAQLFRLVNRLNFVVDDKGMNLTYPVMSAFIKYPTASTKVAKGKLLTKKMGYFTSEKDIYIDINEQLGLCGCRHPLAFLLEAADDIAYLTADLEDAHKKGLISLDSINEYFVKSKDDKIVHKVLDAIEKYRKEAKELGYSEEEEYVIHRMRVLIKGLMINSIYTSFENAYNSIMQGAFEDELLKTSEASTIADILRKIELDNIYYSTQILRDKTRAFAVIKKLLDTYVIAVLNWNETHRNKDTAENLIYQSLSANYRFICEKANENTQDEKDQIYNKLLLVTDQISGMTDTHALEMYRIISTS